MEKSMKKLIDMKLEKTAENLRKNNMEAYVVQNSEEAVKLVESILKEGESISCGGSVTLKETGVFELMTSGRYNFLDRSKAENPEDVYRQVFSCDTFLTSSNAVTENGELYNVDGNSNRVAAICYGPKSVIFIVGMNKIVRNIDEAIIRVKAVAAPPNCLRLDKKTPCYATGECISLKQGRDMASGCKCEDRICCNYVVSAYQRHKNRFKVILVAENLGY